MRVLLDTHILVWALSAPERLDAETLSAIQSADNEVLFSVASIWEIGIKAGLGRADFSLRPEIVLREALEIGFIELPIRSSAAVRVPDLPPIHKDPFDRILVAQALDEPAMLFTADRRLIAYSELVRRIITR